MNPSPLTLRVADGEPHVIHRTLPNYRPTPLHDRPDLAAHLGVGQVLVKDEAHRFGLGAFKGLGASYALGLARRQRETSRVVCTATEGNHGRAVAWAARLHGLEARIFVPEGTDVGRKRAIEGEGAWVEEVTGDYEAAVAEARRAAERDGWLLLQDTAWEGYTEIPLRIMQGYTTALRELESSALGSGDGPMYDVVVLQAGVGSWAAAAAGYLRARWGSRGPRVAVVEPVAAACVLESTEAGSPTEARGSRRTAMNGLNCGLPSTLAHRLLGELAHVFVAVGEAWAQDAVTALAAGTPEVRSAPAGAAGLAGLLAVTEVAEGAVRGAEEAAEAAAKARRALDLDADSRVLVVNTEGPWTEA